MLAATSSAQPPPSKHQGREDPQRTPSAGNGGGRASSTTAAGRRGRRVGDSPSSGDWQGALCCATPLPATPLRRAVRSCCLHRCDCSCSPAASLETTRASLAFAPQPHLWELSLPTMSLTLTVLRHGRRRARSRHVVVVAPSGTDSAAPALIEPTAAPLDHRCRRGQWPRREKQQMKESLVGPWPWWVCSGG